MSSRSILGIKTFLGNKRNSGRNIVDNQYTWIPFYMELADKLKDYSNKRYEREELYGAF